MDDHFIYVQGYPEAIPISPQEAEQVRQDITGERPLSYLPIIMPKTKLLVRVSDVAILESRLKG